ncbi:MAG: hypothetical protein IPI10_01610, partial [Bacteroidetes bacterium]|nr:hypothetical protein [Bacteroidota bacterium]
MNRGTGYTDINGSNYSIDNGTVYTTVSGISCCAFTPYDAVHPTAWVASANGIYSVKCGLVISMVQVISINQMILLLEIDQRRPATPNYIDDYIGIIPVLTV